MEIDRDGRKVAKVTKALTAVRAFQPTLPGL